MQKNRVSLGRYVTEYSVRNKTNENIPVYSVTNSQGFCTEYFDKEVASKDKSTYKIVPRGYFAYNPSRINVGSVDWQKSEDRVIVSPLYNVFSVSDELNQQYLLYFLKSDIGRQMINAKSSGSVRNNLKINMLKEMTIPERTLEEQKKCVAVLDKLKKIITLQEESIKKYEKIVSARFVEMFGNCKEKRKLSEYAELITKGASPRWQGFEYSDNEEGTLFVTSENIREGFIDYSKRKYLPNEINDILPRSVLKRNDVLINIVNASIGRAAIYESDDLANINQAVALVRLKPDSINLKFLLAFLNSDEAIKTYDYMKVGGDKANLSLKNISDLQIPVADMSVQNQFADFVRAIDKSKIKVQKSLDETQKLFDSLMQEYFG